MATYSSNTTIKYANAGNINGTYTGAVSANLLYTVPASHYYVLSVVSVGAATSPSLAVHYSDGTVMHVMVSTSNGSNAYGGGLYLPAGAQIRYSQSAGASVPVLLLGALFTNSP